MALRCHALVPSLRSATGALPSDALAPESWHLLCGNGHSPALRPPSGWPSLWLPLRGPLRLHAVDCRWTLAPGQAQLWRNGAIEARPAHHAVWLCLTGAPTVWARQLASLRADGDPLPWQRTASRALRRQMVQLARRLLRIEAAGLCADDAVAHAVAALLAEQQIVVAARLPRCRGRTPMHRRQTLLRLLHMRHLVRCHVDSDEEAALDLAWLAERTHYSPGHLIRIHREVFSETPAEYIARMRSARAWRLVRDTDRPVAEITHMLGFESQSAFCRAFKHTFGMTATQLRRGEAAPCEPA